MDDQEARRVMDKAAAALGVPSFRFITMCEFRIRDARGWIPVGSLVAENSGKAYQVFWHPRRERGWLWGFIMLPNGVIPRRFDPPKDLAP